MTTSRHTDILFFLSLPVVAALFISSFPVPCTALQSTVEAYAGKLLPPELFSEEGILSASASVISLLCSALILFRISRFLSEEGTFLLPAIYLMLALSNPSSVHFSMMHIAAPMFILAFYLLLEYVTAVQSDRSLFTCIILLFTASLFFPPTIWMAIPFFCIGFPYTEEKIRYFCIAILAIVLPLAFISAVVYLADDMNAALSVPTDYIRTVITLPERSYVIKITGICKYAVLTIMMIAAMIDILKRRGTFKIEKNTLCTTSVITLLSLTIVLVLFLPTNRLCGGLLEYSMVAILLCEALMEEANNRWRVVVPSLLVCLIAAERISYLIF